MCFTHSQWTQTEYVSKCIPQDTYIASRPPGSFLEHNYQIPSQTCWMGSPRDRHQSRAINQQASQRFSLGIPNSKMGVIVHAYRWQEGGPRNPSILPSFSSCLWFTNSVSSLYFSQICEPTSRFTQVIMKYFQRVKHCSGSSQHTTLNSTPSFLKVPIRRGTRKEKK